MNENPFLSTNRLNLPLSHSLCQQIHFSALRRAARGLYPETVPTRIALTELKMLSRYWGSEVYLAHPADVEAVFNGFTLTIYQTITELYCTRLERSIPMVHRLLSKMAEIANVPAIEHEGIWATCLYLEERRKESCEVSIVGTEAEWHLMELRPKIKIHDGKNQAFSPILLGIVDLRRSIMLAFRMAHEEEVNDLIGPVIYDALVTQRKPSQEAVTGLAWDLPAAINSQINLPLNIQQVLTDMGIRTRTVDKDITLTGLKNTWAEAFTGKALEKRYFAKVFDHYLQNLTGYSPLRTQRSLTYKFSHLIGYSKDPAWQFPALRKILPERMGVIAPEGFIEYDRLHYEDPLLKYWPGCQVTLRRSEFGEVAAWIYLDGEILCQAMARELRRMDGTYRLNRPKGV